MARDLGQVRRPAGHPCGQGLQGEERNGGDVGNHTTRTAKAEFRGSGTKPEGQVIGQLHSEPRDCTLLSLLLQDLGSLLLRPRKPHLLSLPSPVLIIARAGEADTQPEHVWPLEGITEQPGSFGMLTCSLETGDWPHLLLCLPCWASV